MKRSSRQALVVVLDFSCAVLNGIIFFPFGLIISSLWIVAGVLATLNYVSYRNQEKIITSLSQKQTKGGK